MIKFSISHGFDSDLGEFRGEISKIFVSSAINQKAIPFSTTRGAFGIQTRRKIHLWVRGGGSVELFIRGTIK